MSASSEIVDSGRFSGHKTTEKSNFSQTFNLLSQYLKENGTFGDLSLGMATGTMNLFPATNTSSHRQQDATAAAAASPVSTQVPKKQPESAQMTIFYAGQVIVLDDFPAEKAMEIMTLAGKGTTQKTQTFRPASDWIPKPTEPSNLVASNIEKESVQLQPVVSDLPIARKASLARFLEKRKERITARSPYQSDNHGSPSKQEEGKSWLGLAAESRGQFQAQSAS
ncbi:protein TIFY 10A [Lactuca sativa]|uniref:Protein TIFY n=1 Tax=Lactuca sativa TaxID=4236 RepID=A0A9R1VCC6_LACSA|nr:protein TIFY 10A [Lactuca sativa]KAJ0203518.1 hypothetical protein LSAT_V11C500279300 [Lactuca sativa]